MDDIEARWFLAFLIILAATWTALAWITYTQLT